MNLLGDFLSFRGRITRRQWWRFQIWALIYLAIVIFIEINIKSDHLRYVIGASGVALLLVTMTCVSIKRIHDRNRSAWWLLLFFAAPDICNALIYSFGPTGGGILSLPFIAANLWGLIELGFLQGTDGQNSYGPDPMNAA
jgi:uncharacterized membrane protein YhaH (DUF805 family)